MPTTGDLLANAAQLQALGYAFIEQIGLLKRWARVGRPVLVGSLRFGLMTTPNLDLEIYAENPTIADGFDVIREIAQLPCVRRVRYENALDTPDQGLYWLIDCVDDEGNTWDIDNWFVANNHPNAGLADSLATAVEKRLDEISRRDILSIKASFTSDAKPRGIDIYKAVLRDGVRTPEEFRRWRRANPAETIEEWCP